MERIVLLSERCRACRRCEVACIAAHHGIDIKEATKRRSEFISRVRVIKGEGYKTTVRCHECSNAPCCHICPTGALEQLESGAVTMHPELCIACEMCADACPYGAIQMDVSPLPVVKVEDNPDDEELQQPRKVAVRCDLCRDWRRENGKTMTPCMEACPAQCIGLMLDDGTTIFPEKPVKKAVVKPAAAPAAKSEPAAEEKPAAKPESAAEEKPAAKPEPAAEEKPAAKPEPAAEEKSAAKPEPAAEEKPAEESMTGAKSAAEAKPAAKHAAASRKKKPAAKHEAAE